MTAPILAATAWPTNAELIADVHRLGYLRDTDRVLDPTYGLGCWWKVWRPADLVTHHGTEDGSDFRDLPYDAGSFDAIAYDPPYVCVGGRTTTGLADMHDRYGQTDAPATPAKLQSLIDDGLAEMARLVRPRGIVLVKCQDYISSGRFWAGTIRTAQAAEAIGLRLEDRLEHVAPTPRPQPPGRRQVHARRNLSTLFVFKKVGRRSVR